jgi:hypothetical protein
VHRAFSHSRNPVLVSVCSNSRMVLKGATLMD